MKIGSHISAAGGVSNAPVNAQKQAGECYQFFSRPPQGGRAPVLTSAEIKKFKENNKKYNFTDFYIHAPYYINLASSDNRIYYSSIAVLREELERGTLLGVKYLMTHLGSAKDLGEAEALKKVIQGIEKILDGYQGSTQFLMEMSAGSGQIIGDTFEEIAKIIENCKWQIVNCLGVCFDTCHAFVSGYDLRDAKAVKKTFDDFDKIIGLDRLKLIHLNDSLAELNSHHDRHADIGSGKIGLTGFEALLREPRLKNINFILETPTEAKRKPNILLLKKIRDRG